MFLSEESGLAVGPKPDGSQRGVEGGKGTLDGLQVGRRAEDVVRVAPGAGAWPVLEGSIELS